jgi:hypothetical protein
MHDAVYSSTRVVLGLSTLPLTLSGASGLAVAGRAGKAPFQFLKF